jgi:hypothetical protein
MSLDSFLNSEVETKEERKKVLQELIEEKKNEVKKIEDERSHGFKAVKLCGGCNKPLSKHEPECAWKDEDFEDKQTQHFTPIDVDDDVILDAESSPDFWDSKHHGKLKKLELKWGCAEIFVHRGIVYGWGDIDHNNEQDIKHNLIKLSQMLEHRNSIRKKRHPKKKGFSSVHKMYDSDIHWETNENFNKWCYEVKYMYKEPMFKLVNDVIYPARWGLEVPMPEEIHNL